MGVTLLIVGLLALNSRGVSQDAPQNPGVQHCEMMQRGDQAMGFSHEITTHHFRLFKEGGEIEVEANNPKDTGSVNQIRVHLARIAQLFAAGKFDVPMFIHDTTPPGVTSMAKLKDQIRYQFLETDSGGRVRITTTGAQARDAVHAFLLFQMADHHTGDSPKIVDELEKK